MGKSAESNQQNYEKIIIKKWNLKNKYFFQ